MILKYNLYLPLNQEAELKKSLAGDFVFLTHALI